MTQFIGLQSRNHELMRSNAPLLVLAGVCLLLLGLLLSQLVSPVVVFGAIALLVACVLVPTRWPHGSIVLLFVASVMPRFGVELGGWNARPEYCSTLLILLAFVFRWIIGQRLKLAFTTTDFLVVGYVVSNYVSSALMSPAPTLTLRWALVNNIVVLPYFLIRILVTDERMLRWAFKTFLAVGIVECSYAVAGFVLHHLAGTSFGTEMDQYAVGLGGVYGTQFEPNILGSYAGCLAIMLLVFYFLSGQKSKWLVWASIISVAAVLVSLSRAAFLSLALVLFALVIIGIRTRVVGVKSLLPVGLAIALFIAPIAATGGRNLLSRLTDLTAGVENDPDSMARLVSWAAALNDIAQHPVAGNGTASFQLLADIKKTPIVGERPWVGNSPLRILHDTGVIGLLLMLAVMLSLARSIRKLLIEGAQQKDIVVALVSGCAVYAIAFMSTEGTMLSFFWIQIGLLASACSVGTKAVID